MKKIISKVFKSRELHLTRPPRLEGKVKNAMMLNPAWKRKKKKIKKQIIRLPAK